MFESITIVLVDWTSRDESRQIEQSFLFVTHQAIIGVFFFLFSSSNSNRYDDSTYEIFFSFSFFFFSFFFLKEKSNLLPTLESFSLLFLFLPFPSLHFSPLFFSFSFLSLSCLPPVLVIMRMWQAYEYRYCPPYRSLANPRRRSGPRKGNCSSETSALSKEHRQIGQGSLSSGVMSWVYSICHHRR